VSNAAAPTYADPVHVVRVLAHDRGPLGALERDVSLCRTTARAAHISFLTGTYRPRNPANADPDGLVVDLAHARDRRSRVVDVSVTGPDDRFSLAAVVGKGQQREVGVGAAGVAEEIARSVPQRALEPAPPEVGVGPRLDPDGEVPPAGSEVFGEVFHGCSPRARGSALGVLTPVTEPFGDDHGHLIVDALDGGHRESLVCERLDQRADGRRIVHFRTVERRVGVRLEKGHVAQDDPAGTGGGHLADRLALLVVREVVEREVRGDDIDRLVGVDFGLAELAVRELDVREAALVGLAASLPSFLH